MLNTKWRCLFFILISTRLLLLLVNVPRQNGRIQSMLLSILCFMVAPPFHQIIDLPFYIYDQNNVNDEKFFINASEFLWKMWSFRFVVRLRFRITFDSFCWRKNDVHCVCLHKNHRAHTPNRNWSKSQFAIILDCVWIHRKFSLNVADNENRTGVELMCAIDFIDKMQEFWW